MSLCTQKNGAGGHKKFRRRGLVANHIFKPNSYGDDMAKIFHLLNENQKLKLNIIFDALVNLRVEYSKDNLHTEDIAEINRMIRELGEYDVANRILN